MYHPDDDDDGDAVGGEAFDLGPPSEQPPPRVVPQRQAPPPQPQRATSGRQWQPPTVFTQPMQKPQPAQQPAPAYQQPAAAPQPVYQQPAAVPQAVYQPQPAAAPQAVYQPAAVPQAVYQPPQAAPQPSMYQQPAAAPQPTALHGQQPTWQQPEAPAAHGHYTPQQPPQQQPQQQPQQHQRQLRQQQDEIARLHRHIEQMGAAGAQRQVPSTGIVGGSPEFGDADGGGDGIDIDPPSPPRVSKPQPPSPPSLPATRAAPLKATSGVEFSAAAVRGLRELLRTVEGGVRGSPEVVAALRDWDVYIGAVQSGAAAGAIPPSRPAFTQESSPIAPPQAAAPPAFRIGEPVEVRCIDDGTGAVRWDPASVHRHDAAADLYVVEFPDGELWDRLPPAELRRASHREPPARQPPARQPPVEPRRDHRAPSHRQPEPRRSASPKSSRPHEERHRGPLPELPSRWAVHDVGPEELAYSGWVWREPEGWLSSRAKQWLIVIGSGRLFLGIEPNDSEFEDLSLQDATVEVTGPLELTVQAGERLRLSTESEYERDVWLVQLEAAAMRARGPQHGDSQLRRRHEQMLAELPCRPCVPVLPGLPEEAAGPPLLTGWHEFSRGKTWLGTPSWEQLYLTVHTAFFAVRNGRGGNAGLMVYPLREAAVVEKELDGEHSRAFEVSSPWSGTVLLTAEGEAEHDRLGTVLRSSLRWSNPDATGSRQRRPHSRSGPPAGPLQSDSLSRKMDSGQRRPESAAAVSDAWGRRQPDGDDAPRRSGRARPHGRGTC